jgi:tRNA(Arg) A34 adenosine deaminase TadA
MSLSDGQLRRIMNDNDVRYVRTAIEIARRARDNGNHPFGAILVDKEGRLLMEAENTVVTDRDPTGHAETNLIRQASRRYDSDLLAACTLYASTEPCPMCSGAIYWGNVRRVVYGLSQEGLHEMIGEESEENLRLSCRDILGKGGRSIEVVGPLLEEEAREVHAGFWPQGGQRRRPATVGRSSPGRQSCR